MMVTLETLYNIGFWVVFFTLALAIRFVTVKFNVFANRIFVDFLSAFYVFAILGFLLYQFMGDWGWHVITGPLLGSAISAFCLMVAFDLIQNLLTEK